MKNILKKIKYLFVKRYNKIKEIKLSTGMLCTHYKDNMRNTILIKVKSNK